MPDMTTHPSLKRGAPWGLPLDAAPSPSAGEAASEARSPWIKLAAIIAAGALTNFTVGLVGALPVGEFVLAGALGWMVLHIVFNRTAPGDLVCSRLLWTFMACQAVALLGYVLSDIYWGSSAGDMQRGWARMIFLGIDVLAFAYLFDLPGRHPLVGFVCFQVGYALGGAAATLSGNVLYDDYWKFGWASPVTITVLLLTPRLGFWCCQIACLALTVVHVAFEFRSMAAICLAAPALMIFQRCTPRTRVVALGAGLALAAVGAGYVSSRRSEDTARSARSDVERGAMVQAAWEGFLRSPWLGNGSWFGKSNVMQEFYAIRYENSVLSGVGSYEKDEAESTVAIHSQILVGLAEGGILGGAFFAFYGVMLFWALGFLVLTQPWTVWSNLCAFFLLLKVSDLATSPFSGAHRVFIAAAVGLILLFWHRLPRRAPVSFP